MIPKTLHYCWFGRGEKPAPVLACIDSWKKYLPDYQIMEWNEDNFDFESYPYAKEAYECRKFAFVSDVARLHALYTTGGVYMDTDFEVLKPLDPFMEDEGFMGFERDGFVATCILAGSPHCTWAKTLLDRYSQLHFIREDGSYDLTTNVVRVTEYLLELGLRPDGSRQKLPGIGTIYPRDFFSPLHPLTGRMTITPNTVAIHHLEGSWKEKPSLAVRFRKWVMYHFGEQAYYKLRSLKLKVFPKPW